MFRLLSSVLCAGLLAATAGCETKAQTGALAGGAGGAALGAIIGHQSGHAAGGALIGGAVGALGGGLVGHGMDKSDERARRDYEARDTYRAGYESRDGVTRGDVVNWTDRGVKDEIIIDRIERSGSAFRLTAADENQLRDRGVSEEVITAMKRSATR